MMRRLAIAAVALTFLILSFASLALAQEDETLGSTGERITPMPAPVADSASPAMPANPSSRVAPPTTTVVPVYHDATGRKEEDLSPREKHFLATVPEKDENGKCLRQAAREMLLANPPVVHPPDNKCGNYVPGTSRWYWGIYQAWTGPHKAKIQVLKGERGGKGDTGERGPEGKQGPAGQGSVTNNWYVTPSQPVAAAPLGVVIPGQTVVYAWGGVGYTVPVKQTFVVTNVNANINDNANIAVGTGGNATANAGAAAGAQAQVN